MKYGGGWTLIANKSSSDSFYYPTSINYSNPLGWYDLTINNNGTFSYDLRRFNTTLTIKLTSTSNFIAIFKTDGMPSINKSLIPISKPTTNSILDKPYSLATSTVAIDFSGFGNVGNQLPWQEGPCAIFDRNLSSPLGNTNYSFILLQNSIWEVGALSWCPNGLSGFGDYNYDGYNWNMHNFTGQGSSLKVWVK